MNIYKSISKREGFTLIELMIVVSIIGILSAALIPNLSGATGRARDAQRRVLVNQVVTELENFYIDNDRYPIVDPTTPTAEYFCINGADETDGFGAYFPEGAPAATKPPETPGPCGEYIGYYSADGNGYSLYMAIEGKKGDRSFKAATTTEADVVKAPTADESTPNDPAQIGDLLQYIYVER